MSDVNAQNDNIYGNYDNVSDLEVSGFAPCKIHDNVVLGKVEYFTGVGKTSGNSYECLKFTYERKTDNAVQYLTDQVMPINKAAMATWKHTVSLQDTFDKQVINFNTKMKHIATKFGVTLDELKQATSGNTSFNQFAVKYANLLSSKLDGRKMYMKTMVDDNGRAEIPMFPPFLEIMTANGCNMTFSKKEKEMIQKYKDSTPSADTVNEVLEVDDEFSLD